MINRICHKLIASNYQRLIGNSTSFKINSRCFAKSSAPEVDESEDYFLPQERIRNFSIIAHVDHGKSTLADRLLEATGAKKKNSDKNQVLDMLLVEQERGITVKANSVSLLHQHKGSMYLLNLIDTPGHVDFSNEVCRSLSAVDAVLLLVDANHGIQAQTLANHELAVSKNLKVIPVLNKIDLKHANPDKVAMDLEKFLGYNADDIIRISAKMGIGIDKVFESICEKMPPPKSNRDGTFRGHLFDSWYDKYRGALNLMFVKDGIIEVGQEITSCNKKATYVVKSLSILTPEEKKVDKLISGQIGLVGCNMRNSKDAIIGDTYYLKGNPVEPLEEFKRLRPMIFAGIFPPEQSQHVQLRSAIEKLVLNDSVVTVEIDSSPALGQGFRLGFLGILHLEVFAQRLQQEYQSEPIITSPSVTYRIKFKPNKTIIQKNGGKEMIEISNPKHFPDPQHVEEYFEPIVDGKIITPAEYLGGVMGLCNERRGYQKFSINLDDQRIMMTYTLPLSEILMDFHDRIKSISSGFASFDFDETAERYVTTHIVKMDVLLNGVAVEELSSLVHFSRVDEHGRYLVDRLKELIPRQMVQIAIQAVVGGKVIARETIKAYRKDVTQWLYGGDVTRRQKLLKNQAEGKKKMRSIANIVVPRDTFIKLLRK